MFEKIRRLFPSARRQAKNDRVILYVFFGLAAAVVIISSFMSSRGVGPGVTGSVAGQPAWNLLLPPGAQTTENSVVSLPDEPQPAYAVGYAFERIVSVALVAWDKVDSRYVIVADRNLGQVKEGQTAKIPILSLVNLGPGAAPAIMVRAAAGDTANAIMFINRINTTLAFIEMRDGKGQVGPAFFIDGQFDAQQAEDATVSGQSYLELKDVNGDKLPEVVLSEKQLSGGWKASVSVYVWREGKLDFDRELSKQLTTDMPIVVE